MHKKIDGVFLCMMAIGDIKRNDEERPLSKDIA